MGIIRAESIARARGYIREGVSANRWIREMRAKGLGYRRTTMLSDYRSVLHLETKKDYMKYVRRDRYPTGRVIADVTWDLSAEFMYVSKIKTVLRPGDPPIEYNINYMSDVPLTPEMIIEKSLEKRIAEEKYIGEIVIEITPWTAARRVPE